MKETGTGTTVALVSVLVFGALLAVVAGQPASALDKASLLAPSPATVSGGNPFYQVFVENAGSDLGQYTATTGPSHPAGAGLNVLFGDGDPGTTFNTIRSYTTNTDYIQAGSKTSSNPTVSLGTFGATSAIGTTGVRTTYTLPGGATTPDALTIVQDVNVNGTTFANSTIEVTTKVTNNGTGPVQIGVRYEWDFQIGEDDGPTFQAINPDGAVLINETQFPTPTFQAYKIEDNDVNPSPPTFDVFGTVTGPGTVVPTPTAPDLLEYVSWPNSFNTAFDYAVNPALDVATIAGEVNDSAVLYFFGHNSASAITIAASATATVSASLFLRQAAPQAVKRAPALNGAILLALVMLLGGGGVWLLSRRRALAQAHSPDQRAS